MASTPESEGGMVDRTAPSKRSLVRRRRRRARGVADRGLTTGDVMSLTRGEEEVILVDTKAAVKLVTPQDPAIGAGEE